MSKTKSSEIPHYELLYIISNKFSEDELAPINAKVVKILESNEAKITLSEDWGKKKLAYPIKNFSFGYYHLIEFDANGEKLKKITRSFRMANEILRYMIVIKPYKSEKEIKKEKEISEKIAIKTAEHEKLEQEKTKGKVDLKDLDEKLDKILETDDLL